MIPSGRSRPSRAWLLGAALLVVALVPLSAARAQDQSEAEELVKSIRKDLSEIDTLLEQASEADEVQADLGAARAAHVRVIGEIERLIKMVKYQKGGGGGGGGGGKPQGGGGGKGQPPPPRGADGRDQQEQQQPQGGAPQPPQAKDGSSQQQESGAEQPGERTDQGGGANKPGDTKPPDPTAPFERRDTDARWGLLPPKLQERLMNLHVDDVPERYRIWLEAYIRELNRRDEASGP